MKDSKVKWLGAIPLEWKVERVKHGFIRKKAEAHQDNPIVLSLARTGVRERDISNNEGQIAESYYNYNPVDVDDLLINPMDLYSGANCSISKISGVISPAYVNLRYREGYNPQYYDYYFKLQYWLMAFFAHGKGVSYENRWTLNAETLMNYPIIVPTECEQRKIVDYLNTKCSKIDEIIQKQKVIIEKLKEYKLSVISEIVTKGLNRNVEMKDSQDDFVGEIPYHWEMLKFGRCISVKSNLVPPDDYKDYPQISPDCIEKGAARLVGHKTVEESGVISWNHLFFKGQIIYSKIRPLLDKVVIAPFDGLCSADMYPIETSNNPKFVVYMMLSAYFHSQVALVTENRVKMPKINQNELTNITVVMPPMEEQKEIVEWLDRKCHEIDKNISARELLIEKYSKYKKSLIFEVVTGKKEV